MFDYKRRIDNFDATVTLRNAQRLIKIGWWRSRGLIVFDNLKCSDIKA